MSTTIHHGPPGSFKSFTLVQRFAITALTEGRVVITNIRGLTSIDRIKDNFPDLDFPESAQLIFVNSESEFGRKLMAGWFHWVPLRALVIIDEAQRIYPDRRDFRLEQLDSKITPDGFHVDEIEIQINDEYTGAQYTVRRPEDVLTAFDMQRHFQWDVHLSTTNVGKIQTRIREVAEFAYRHRSLAGKLPWFKNTWQEIQHDAENSGKLATHYIGQPRRYKADPRVFACYQSTATGEHTDSKADQSILSDPKIRLMGFVITCALGYNLYSFATAKPAKKPTSVNPSPAVQSPVQDHQPTNPATPAPLPDSPVHVSNAPVSSSPFALVAFATFHPDRDKIQIYALDSSQHLRRVRHDDLVRMGYVVKIDSYCLAHVTAPDSSVKTLTCFSPALPPCTSIATSPDTYSQTCEQPIQTASNTQP